MATNIALFKKMIDRYNELSYTHDYIFGFAYQKNIYMVETTAEILPHILKLDKASRGQGMSLRFCPNKVQKSLLLSLGATLLCSETFFKESVAESKYNKGEIFEKMVTEFFGQTWEKDNLKFTEGGDLDAYGVSYQIKFERATFTNEKTLAGM